MKKLNLTIVTVFLSTALILSISTKTFSEENSIKDIVTDLYTHYEAVDRELKELKGVEKTLRDGPSLTPFSLGIKNEAPIEFISINIDKEGIPFASHLYSERDNKALTYGSRQLIYKGQIKQGKQAFVLYYIYKSKSKKIIKSKATWKIGVSKSTTYLELVFKEKNGRITVVPRKITN